MLNTIFTPNQLSRTTQPTRDYDHYAQRVQKMVTPKRYEHILRVFRLSDEIARSNYFNADEQQATLLAALLHDAARDLSTQEIFALAPAENAMERANPMALHGKAGAVLARRWGVEDARVLDAIAGHVFGVQPRNRIGMAVYIADISEPARGVNEDIRELAMHNLEQAYYQAVSSKINYLHSQGKTVHPRTLAAYQSMQAVKVPMTRASSRAARLTGAQHYN